MKGYWVKFKHTNIWILWLHKIIYRCNACLKRPPYPFFFWTKRNKLLNQNQNETIKVLNFVQSQLKNFKWSNHPSFKNVFERLPIQKLCWTDKTCFTKDLRLYFNAHNSYIWSRRQSLYHLQITSSSIEFFLLIFGLELLNITYWYYIKCLYGYMVMCIAFFWNILYQSVLKTSHLIFEEILLSSLMMHLFGLNCRNYLNVYRISK